MAPRVGSALGVPPCQHGGPVPVHGGAPRTGAAQGVPILACPCGVPTLQRMGLRWGPGAAHPQTGGAGGALAPCCGRLS